MAFCACSGCHDVHELGIRLSLDDGPPHRQNVGDLYKGKELAPELESVTGIYTACPRTGIYFCQRDTFQCFLVPVSDDDGQQEHNHQRQDDSFHRSVRR